MGIDESACLLESFDRSGRGLFRWQVNQVKMDLIPSVDENIPKSPYLVRVLANQRQNNIVPILQGAVQQEFLGDLGRFLMHPPGPATTLKLR